MKKILALILTACMLMSLCSCALIRKIEPVEAEPEKETAPEDSNTVETEFSETKEEDTTEEEISYTEDEAYDLLAASLGITEEADADKAPVITKTGAIIAQSNGTEYYIFDVEYPEKEDADTEKDTENGESSGEEAEQATTFYVSKNGIIYDTLEEANTTTLLAAANYTVKHGEVDSATGFKYKLEYKGLIKNLDLYCYNFIVYLEDDSSGEVNLVYKTNYLVTLDGKSSGEQKLE